MYVADLEAQRKLREIEEHEKEKIKNKKKKEFEKHESLPKLEIKSSNHYTNLRVAEGRIKIGNQIFKEALSEISLPSGKL